MIQTTDLFQTALRSSHVLDLSATAVAPDGTNVDIPIDADSPGEVVLDRTAVHRAQLSLTCADPTLYPVLASDPLNVYGTEVTVYRGIVGVDRVQLGIFRVESLNRDTPSGGIDIVGYDRSRQVFDQRFLVPRKFAAMTGVTLISQLITEVYPNAVINVLTSDTTNIPKHHVDRDRWAECQRVAKVIGCEVFVNNVGEWVIQDIPDPSTAQPVWRADAGPGGVLVGLNDQTSREAAPNIVVAIGESVSGNNPSYYGIARDEDPLSPTYYLGPYGKVPRFFSSQYIHTQAQADLVATRQLQEHLGVSRTMTFTAVPNPALEPGDTVRVVRPDGTREDHFLDAITIPLGAGDDIEGSTRAIDWKAE